jgi:hypothetical protein
VSQAAAVADLVAPFAADEPTPWRHGIFLKSAPLPQPRIDLVRQSLPPLARR